MKSFNWKLNCFRQKGKKKNPCVTFHEWTCASLLWLLPLSSQHFFSHYCRGMWSNSITVVPNSACSNRDKREEKRRQRKLPAASNSYIRNFQESSCTGTFHQDRVSVPQFYKRPLVRCVSKQKNILRMCRYRSYIHRRTGTVVYMHTEGGRSGPFSVSCDVNTHNDRGE